MLHHNNQTLKLGENYSRLPLLVKSIKREIITPSLFDERSNQEVFSKDLFLVPSFDDHLLLGIPTAQAFKIRQIG